MGKSVWLARLVAVCAVTALTGGALVVAPANADTRGAPALSVATPAAVRGDAVLTCLRIKIAGVSPGGRANVTVTGPKQRPRAAKRYTKIIHRSTTLRVVPGVYRVTSRSVDATGGSDVPQVATKTLRVRKNHCPGFTVRYRFVASGPVSLPQTITFTQPVDTSLYVEPPVPDATSDSGLAVTYTSATLPVCTVTGAGVITFMSVGTCTINADQAGNATYSPALQVSRSFAVTPED